MLNLIQTQTAPGTEVLSVKSVRQGFEKGSGELLVLDAVDLVRFVLYGADAYLAFSEQPLD